MSAELMQQLTAPFAIDEHKVREGATSKNGNIQWLVYIDKEPIINRLNALFGLTWGETIETRQLDKGVVVVDCHITINGVSRGLNGADSKSFNDHDIAKSAGSDAFKRAATMWGIGLYLYSAPTIWTEGYKDGNSIDWKKKDAMEAEALGKVQSWLRQLGLASPTTANNNRPDTTEAKKSLGQNGQHRVGAEKKADAPKVESERDGVKWFNDGDAIQKFADYLQRDNDPLPCIGYFEAISDKTISEYPDGKTACEKYLQDILGNADKIGIGNHALYQKIVESGNNPFSAYPHFENWMNKHGFELDIQPTWQLSHLIDNIMQVKKANDAAKPENGGGKDDAPERPTDNPFDTAKQAELEGMPATNGNHYANLDF